ncbi:hypothetical protein KC340_g4942 [Hortaea werneckii]|nr:hypothetical protein KC342_g14096 [Hortaea werneckii]KAI7101958.1 hypothetical protein KC339_g6345 [Hortaea werneckii]KAI7222646.1 hypothetical protein KC365_g11346 [Hortaea werneckii]KAI7328823.1 hypothetical protein KC340_g4942 [Hortaea werneckii]KAI7397602.1 hypothetical protein KC328_g4830 [Hortaea werneckii]
MESHAAGKAKAAVADLMSMAKWKAPHASAVAWQAGLDEIDRFYRSAIGQSATGPQSIADSNGKSHEYSAEQAGSNGPQSMPRHAYEKPLTLIPYKVPHPMDYELTLKQNGAPVLQQQQAAESLLQPDSSVPRLGSKLHPPHASSSLDLENKTSLPGLKQDSLFTEVETSPAPSQTHHQPPSHAVESDLLKPPTQQAKKTPSAQSQSSLPRSKSVQQDSSTPLLPRTHEWPPLQQNSQWNSVDDITARPKWTLEPPPPPGLQPAFEEKGKAPDEGTTGEGSQVAIPLREKLEKGGSRPGGASVSRDGLAGGDEGRKVGFLVENEGREVDSADDQRRSGELRANVTERDQGADVTVCQEEEASDGIRSDREDDVKGSAPDGDASPAITHTSAPDTVVANDQHEREESNEQTDTPQRDDDTTTLPNLPDQPTSAAEPHIHPKVRITNPPRRSPTNSRTFSNARDEIASLKRGRENSSSTRSSSSSQLHSASSPLPPARKKKKTRNEQTTSSSDAGKEASEQSPPEEPKPEDRNADSVHAPTPADQGSPGDTAESDPPATVKPPAQSPSASSPSSSKEKEKEEKEKEKENKNQTHETKKRKRSPRRAMSKRELSNLEGTTVEGKLRRRGVQEREGELQPQPQLQPQLEQQRVQKQQKQQVQKERKGQREGQEEEGKEKGKDKGERNEGKQGKGKESPATGDGASRRKRQRRS